MISFIEVTPKEKLIDIVALYEDFGDNLWIGTLGNGLYFLQKGSKEPIKITDLPETHNSILSINGYENKIWIASFGGVTGYTYSNEDVTRKPILTPLRYPSFQKVEPYFVYTLFVDSKKQLWLGTDGNGIGILNKNEFKVIQSPHVKGKTVYSIAEDNSGHIWFSVAEGGLFEFDGKSLKKFGTKNGLRSNNISSVRALNNNKIALVHAQGIDIFNPITQHINYLGTNTGMGKINPDLNASCIDLTGKLWVGSEKGILIFNPQEERFLPIPKTIIHGLKIFNVETSQLGKHEFKHDQNNIAFTYSALWYANPEMVKTEYQLHGFDKDWIETKDRNLIFSSLPPGNYELKIRSSLNDNFLLSTTTTYTFIVEKPFWEENWFIFLIFLILSTSLILFLKYRDRRVKRIFQLEQQKVEYQFETLKNQVNPHFLFNSFNTLISIIDEDKELAQKYAEKLSDFFRLIVTYKDKDLIELREEISVVENYVFLQKMRFGDNLQLKIDIAPHLYSQLIPPLVLQIVLENVIKHNAISSQTPVIVIIYSKDQSIIIENNLSPKRNPERSTGSGLQNIRNRFKFFTERELKVDCNNKYFIVSLPLISVEENENFGN